eukprot:g21116.t1
MVPTTCKLHGSMRRMVSGASKGLRKSSCETSGTAARTLPSSVSAAADEDDKDDKDGAEEESVEGDRRRTSLPPACTPKAGLLA